MSSKVETRGDTSSGKAPAEPSSTRPPSLLKKRLIRFAFFLFVMGAILFSAQKRPLISDSTIQQLGSGKAAEALDAGSLPGAVLTSRNDQLRTGLNGSETKLNVSNVNAAHFGKRIAYPVDGAVYAQPLFVPHLLIQGTYHNVVFVATENDSVYAFDADQTQVQGPLWKTSFIAPPAVVPETHNDVYCSDLGPSVGITGTPVIDAKTLTLYVVAATKEHGKYFSRLHALDLLSGQERAHSPATITASVPGRSKDA